jgi:hypothetical protein
MHSFHVVSDTKYNVVCFFHTISRAGFIKVRCRISPFIDEEIEGKKMNKRMMTKLNGGMKNQCQRGRAARAGRG